MSLVNIKVALETRLAAMTNVLPTHYDNETYVSDPQTSHQRVNFLFAPPEQSTIAGTAGSMPRRERGIFQVSIVTPLNIGSGTAIGLAEAIRDWFAKGMSFVANGVTVRILQEPVIHSGFVDDATWVTPVSIYYTSDIN